MTAADRPTLARYGLDHPTWDAPDCFHHATAEEARAGAIRTYGEDSGHVVIGPCDALLDELEALRGVVAAVRELRETWAERAELPTFDHFDRLVCDTYRARVDDLTAALDSAPTEEGLAVAEHLLRGVADYWDGRPLTHHGDHIYADLCDVLRAITPATKGVAR